MKTVGHPLRLLSAAVIALFLVAPNVRAANMLIDAGNIEELVTFTFSQFEGGFSINGSTPTSGGSFTFGEGTQLNFNGLWLDQGQASALSRTVYWVEPQAPSVISEILMWSIAPSAGSGFATISGLFQAEGLGTLPPGVNPADIIVELFDGSHDPFTFTAPFLTGQVITGAGDVPEPSTCLLLTVGILGLIGRRCRRPDDAQNS